MPQLINPKYFDRLLGFALSIAGGISLYGINSWLHSMTFKKNDFSMNSFCGMTAPKGRLGCFNGVTNKPSCGARSEKVTHTGKCLCGSFRFRLRAEEVINVVDYHTKIRFPRLTIPLDELEITDSKSLSQYSVTDGCQSGTHSFCSFCGMQVLYSPSHTTYGDQEVVVNVDCLDRATVRQVNVSYGGAWTVVPSLLPLQLSENLQSKLRDRSCSETADLTSRDSDDLYMELLSESGSESTDDQTLENVDTENGTFGDNDDTNLCSTQPDTERSIPIFNTLAMLYDSEFLSSSNISH